MTQQPPLWKVCQAAGNVTAAMTAVCKQEVHGLYMDHFFHVSWVQEQLTVVKPWVIDSATVDAGK